MVENHELKCYTSENSRERVRIVYQIAVRVLASGERALFLLDSRGCPLFYPTLFVTSQLRNAGAPANTIKNKLAHIVVLLRWQDERKRDLVDDFRSGRFLTVADIVSLRDFTQRDMRDVREANKPVSGGYRHGVALLEGRTAQSMPSAAVGGPQQYNRLTTIADYLAFVAAVVTQHKGLAEDVTQIERMAERIRKHRPRGLSRSLDDDPHIKSPPSELIDRFMDIAAVDHPKNPFRDPGVRLRNAILFGLLRHTGMRRGELLSLRVGDVDVGHEPTVWVRRNHDDAADPRRHQPVAKTKERPLPLPIELAIQIQDYVLNHRAKIPAARRHGYLLVSHKKGSTFGQPLSQTALGSQIMAKMRSVDPAFADIHPHSFRHHFNYELSRRVDEHNVRVREHGVDGGLLPISEAREQDVRAFVNGHRSKASAGTYNQRHVREVADRAIRELQRGMRSIGSKDGKSGDGDR